MSYQYDYFISYAQEDNADGFVEQFVERLVNTPDLEPLLGAEPRVFFDKEAACGVDDWESAIRAEIDASLFMIVFLSPNYFKSERCAAELNYWLVSEKRRSLPDSGITLVQVADVPGLFDNGTVNVPQALQDRFPNWVSELRKRQISADFDLRDRASASIDRALAALCRDSLDSVWSLDWTSAAPEDGSSPDDDEKNDADDADDSPQVSENYKKAVEKIEKLLEENPDEIDRARILNAYYMEMGGWAEAEGELEDAKEYYEKALGTNAHILSLQPDDPEAWYDSCIASSALGVLWEAEGDRVQARKKLRNGAENSDKNCRGKFGRS